MQNSGQIEKSGRIATVGTILLSLITTAPGFFLSLEDSEIWGITSSRRFVDEIGSITSAHIKPLFSLVFGTIVHLAPTDWEAFIFSRVFTVALATAGLYSLIRLISFAFHSDSRRIAAYTVLGLTFATPVFLLHFTKARSDTVAVSICLIALLQILLVQHKQRAFLIAAIATLLVTPKSLDLAAVLAIFAWSTRPPNTADSKPVEVRIKQLTWLLSPLAFVLGLALLFSREPLLKAATYWVDSFQRSPITAREHWSHLIMAAQSAWVTTAALALGSITSLFLICSKERKEKLSHGEKLFVRSGLIVVLFMLIHSQKYQFFIASRMPFLFMLAAPGWVRLLGPIVNRTSGSQANSTGASQYVPRTILAGVAIVLISFALSIDRIHRVQMFALDLQKDVHTNLLAFLTKANPSSYWDAIGLFPKRNQIFHFPSPSDRVIEDLPNYVELSKPAVVIRTPKMNLLEPDLFVWLQKNYAPISDEIHVRVAHIPEAGFSHDCTLGTEMIKKRAAEAGLHDRDLLLMVKTKTNPKWNQVPFRIPLKHQSVQSAFAELSADSPSVELVFIGCKEFGTQYAVSEAGPWKARPVLYNSTLFGYDGRL